MHAPKSHDSAENPARSDDPAGWAASSAPLMLPKGNLPILFYTYLPTPNAEAQSYSTGHLFLAIVTRNTVYIYESAPSRRRDWAIVHDYYMPSCPKFVHLLDLPSNNVDISAHVGVSGKRVRSTSKGAAPVSPKLPASSTPPGYTLLVGMRSKLVLIRLADASVREIEVAGIANNPSPINTGRSRADSKSSVKKAELFTRRRNSLKDKVIDSVDSLKEGLVAMSLGRQSAGWTSVFPMQTCDRKLLFLTHGSTTCALELDTLAEAVSTTAGPRLPTDIQATHITPSFVLEWSTAPRCVIALPKSKIFAFVACTSTAVEVQEGSMSATSGSRLVPTPISIQQVSSNTDTLDDEVTDRCVYDFSSGIRALNAERCTQSRSGSRILVGVQALGDYQLRWIS